MKKGFYILAWLIAVNLSLTGISFCIPPPCEFFPDSGEQGSTITVVLYLLCGIDPDPAETTLVFDVPGLEVVQITGGYDGDYSVTIRIAPDTPPGTYSPAILSGVNLVASAEDAAGYWLMFTVLPSPDGVSPCVFYPDSVTQGEQATLDLYLHCASLDDSGGLPDVIFDGVDIAVDGIRKKSANRFEVDLRVGPDVVPGMYSPYVLVGNDVALDADEARDQGLSVSVNESLPRFSLYPDSPQRTGTSSIYLIKGVHTNFRNGATLVSSNHKSIFPIFQYVFTPLDMVVVLSVLYDVAPGSYDLTMVTGDEAMTEAGVVAVIE